MPPADVRRASVPIVAPSVLAGLSVTNHAKPIASTSDYLDLRDWILGREPHTISSAAFTVAILQSPFPQWLPSFDRHC